jgi:hypothetical protein
MNYVAYLWIFFIDLFFESKSILRQNFVHFFSLSALWTFASDNNDNSIAGENQQGEIFVALKLFVF